MSEATLSTLHPLHFSDVQLGSVSVDPCSAWQHFDEYSSSEPKFGVESSLPSW